MAKNLDDGEFWLPTAFLSDDFPFLETKMGYSAYSRTDPFSYGFGGSSDPDSPVESLVGSTETESDEENFMAGLTLQMAQSTLRDDSGFRSEDPKLGVLSGSPQSTLCNLRGRCGCTHGSSDGSPNGPSRGPSPPPETWDLLYAAAGEVAKLSVNEEGTGYYDGRSLFSHVQIPNSFSHTQKNNPNSSSGSFYHESRNHLNSQATQFHRMKQMEMMKQQSRDVWGGLAKKGDTQYQYAQLLQNRGRNGEFVGGRNPRPLGLSPSAWPPLQQPQNPKPHQQQHKGSGMRALFLDSPGTKRTSVGTGVFLPRRAGTPPETRKRPACSTALLPARVVQALNLNLEELGAQTQFHPRSNGSLGTDSDVSFKLRSHNGQPSHEIRLPQEWTY